jgi:hypothetical protein
MENFDFIGRKYSDEEKEVLNKQLQERFEHAHQPIEHELEKSDKDVELIDGINLIIEKELGEMGIDGFTSIDKEQIHFLSANQFEKEFPGNSSRGLHFSTEKGIYVNKDANPQNIQLLVTLFHEMIHCTSKTKYYSEDNVIYDARSGYRVTSDWKEKDRAYLEGFNELVVDYTVYFWLHKNTDFFEEKFGITKEDINGGHYAYMGIGMLMEKIVSSIAEKRQKIDPEQGNMSVLADLIKGQFDNTLLFLKEVEETFGKGSIEILSKLGANTEENNPELFIKIMDYFMLSDSGNEEQRDSIRTELLS